MFMSKEHVHEYKMNDNEDTPSEKNEVESGPKNRDCEAEHSIDLSVLDVRLSPAREDHDDDCSANVVHIDCDSDQGSASVFNVSTEDFVQSCQQSQIQDGNCLEIGLAENKRNDFDQLEHAVISSIWVSDETQEESEGGCDSSLTIEQCKSPKSLRVPESTECLEDVEQTAYTEQSELDKQDDELGLDQDNYTQKMIVVLSSDNLNENSDPSLLQVSARIDQDQLYANVDECDHDLGTSTTEAHQDIKTQKIVDHKSMTLDSSPPDSLEQQPTSIKFSSADSIQNTTDTPVYTVESLFPVVYERNLTSEASKVASIPLGSSNPKSSRHQRRQFDADKNAAGRIAALEAQLNAALNDQSNATRTLRLQLSIVELDNKKLSQRNTRLKHQLSMVIADLQRSNAEMAKLKTENEIYAAKLLRLQAELLEETSQVDETQALSLQNGLVLTQLKARSHVIQTRNLGLEAHNKKLIQQLRESQQNLKRQVIVSQQQTERANKVETDMNKLKIRHAQDKMAWKSQMTSALQRFQHDKMKVEAQMKTKERNELREAKSRVEKAVKKRRTAESISAGLEMQLTSCKQELGSATDAIQQHVNEVRTLEDLLRKSHRVEATLRKDLAACKTRIRALQNGQKRRAAGSHPVQMRHRWLGQKVSSNLLLSFSDSSDSEENQQHERCSHCLASSRSNEPLSPLPMSSVCNECLRLQEHIHQLQQELRRVRSLHTIELHAQASILDTLVVHSTKSN